MLDTRYWMLDTGCKRLAVQAKNRWCRVSRLGISDCGLGIVIKGVRQKVLRIRKLECGMRKIGKGVGFLDLGFGIADLGFLKGLFSDL